MNIREESSCQRAPTLLLVALLTLLAGVQLADAEATHHATTATNPRRNDPKLLSTGDTGFLADLVLVDSGNTSTNGGGGSSGHPTSSDASGFCSEFVAACAEDDVCLSCWKGPAPDESLTCEDRYPNAFETTCEGGFFCEREGAGACCEFVDNETAEECLTNRAMAAYWACVMDFSGCALGDLPCVAGEVLSMEKSESPGDNNTEMDKSQSAAATTTTTELAESDTGAEGSGIGTSALSVGASTGVLLFAAGTVVGATASVLVYGKIRRGSRYTQLP